MPKYFSPRPDTLSLEQAKTRINSGTKVPVSLQDLDISTFLIFSQSSPGTMRALYRSSL